MVWVSVIYLFRLLCVCKVRCVFSVYGVGFEV